MSVALLDNGAQVAKPVGRKHPKGTHYTGEEYARRKPKQYRAIANYLAEGWSQRKITRFVKCHFRIVTAIAKREAEQIEARKKQLVTKLANIADLGAIRVEATIGKASVRDAVIGTGVAVDKMLALLGQSPAVQVANIIMPSDADRQERRQLHDKLDAITARLNAQP